MRSDDVGPFTVVIASCTMRDYISVGFRQRRSHRRIRLRRLPPETQGKTNSPTIQTPRSSWEIREVASTGGLQFAAVAEAATTLHLSRHGWQQQHDREQKRPATVCRTQAGAKTRIRLARLSSYKLRCTALCRVRLVLRSTQDHIIETHHCCPDIELEDTSVGDTIRFGWACAGLFSTFRTVPCRAMIRHRTVTDPGCCTCVHRTLLRACVFDCDHARHYRHLVATSQQSSLSIVIPCLKHVKRVPLPHVDDPCSTAKAPHPITDQEGVPTLCQRSGRPSDRRVHPSYAGACTARFQQPRGPGFNGTVMQMEILVTPYTRLILGIA